MKARCVQSTLQKIPALLASGNAVGNGAFVFTDWGSSPTREHCSLNIVPCVTTSRGAQRRLAVLKAPKFDQVAELSVDCLAFCQGWTAPQLAALRRKLPDASIAAALGNAIALPILRELGYRLIPRIINGRH